MTASRYPAPAFDRITLTGAGSSGPGDGFTARDPATGAVDRPIAAAARERHISLGAFGAFGGDAEKDTAALELACAWANGPDGDGRPPYIPPGRGSLKRTIDHYSTFTGGADRRRVGLVGEGSGVSQLVWVGPAGPGTMINWGTLSTDPSRGQFNSHARVGGFTLDGAGRIDTGLRTFRQAWFLVDDLRLTAFRGAAYHSESCVSYSIRGMRSFLSSTGALFEKGSDPRSFTTPNAILLEDCTFGSHDFVGVEAVDCGPLIMLGGSIEGCGSAGSPGGLRVTKSGLELGIETMMLLVHGTYFEANRGRADVVFTNASTRDAAIGIDGANFNRERADACTTNNILMEILGPGQSSIAVDRTAFNAMESYVRDGARRVFDIVGNVGQVGDLRWGQTNRGDRDVDAPILNGPWDLPAGRPKALCRYSPNIGAIIRKLNIGSVARLGVGQYRLVYNYPIGTASNIYGLALIGGQGRIDVTEESPAGVSIEVSDPAGVPTDALGFSLVVY